MPLDPEFAALVRGDDYHVFPVPEADTQGLYIATKPPAGFERGKQQGGTTTGPSNYRVRARRKDDGGRRLEEVTIGAPVKLVDVPHLQRPTVPDPPARER